MFQLRVVLLCTNQRAAKAEVSRLCRAQPQPKPRSSRPYGAAKNVEVPAIDRGEVENVSCMIK